MASWFHSGSIYEQCPCSAPYVILAHLRKRVYSVMQAEESGGKRSKVKPFEGPPVVGGCMREGEEEK